MQRVGLRSYFTGNEPTFTESFVKIAKAQRGRKEEALSEIRKTISEKEIYAPYSNAAQSLLNQEIEKISSSLDVDPQSYNRAVADYAKFYNYSKNFEKFINDTAANFKGDDEVNYNEALAALKKKYVQTGSLDELEANVNGGMNAEEVLLQTPGALNEGKVINNAIKEIGTTIDEFTKLGKLGPSANKYFLQMDTENIRREFSNIMEVDSSTGQVRIKNPEEFKRSGIAKAMLFDDRMKAIVDRNLTAEGKELTDENRVNALPNLLSPYASVAQKVDARRDLREDPKFQEARAWAQIQMERERMQMDVDENTSIFATNVLAHTKAIKEGNSKDLVSTVFNTKQYEKNRSGQIINKSGLPIPADADPEKSGATRLTLPSGYYAYGSNEQFKGYENDSYVFGDLIVDRKGTAYIQAYAKKTQMEQGDDVMASVALDGQVRNIAVSQKPTYILFNPNLFNNSLRSEAGRRSYNRILNNSGLGTFTPKEVVNPNLTTKSPLKKPESKDFKTIPEFKKALEEYNKEVERRRKQGQGQQQGSQGTYTPIE
jgi:hypothetical protein